MKDPDVKYPGVVRLILFVSLPVLSWFFIVMFLVSAAHMFKADSNQRIHEVAAANN